MGHPYGTPTSYYSAAPPVRRRKRWPWVLLVVVILLGGLFVVADRLALHFTEDKAAAAMQSSQHLQHKPNVSVGGFPFLTQLASRHFDDVTISAAGIDVGSGPTLRIDAVIVHLHGVTAPSNYSSVRADTAVADARIAYADLSHTLGVPVTDGGNGRLVATPSATFAGHTFSARVTAVVHASSDKGITFADPTVSAAGLNLPDIVTQTLATVFQTVISLKRLPFGVRVDSTDVTPTGVVLRMSGHNLVYSRR